MLHVAGYQMHTGRWRRETIDRPFACSQKHIKDSAQAYVRHQMEGPSSTGPADIAEPAGGDVERGTQHGSPFVNMEDVNITMNPSCSVYSYDLQLSR